MANVSIRAASQHDIQAISALVQRAVRLINSADYDPEIINLICSNFTPEKIFAKMQERDVFIGHLNDRCVGTVSLGNGKLHSLFVEPDLQRCGIGRRLVAYLEQFAVEKGLQELLLSSSITARHFYERLGYQLISFEERMDGSTYLMNRRLTPR